VETAIKAMNKDSRDNVSFEEFSHWYLHSFIYEYGKMEVEEDFDNILGIHEVENFDSKRIKRARLIKSINKQYEEKNGYPLIMRIKNPEDKRFIFYKITFYNES